METAAPTPNAEAQTALSPWQLFWQRLKRRRIAMVGGAILILLYLVALFAGFVAPYSYDRLDTRLLLPSADLAEAVRISSGCAALRTAARRFRLSRSSGRHEAAPFFCSRRQIQIVRPDSGLNPPVRHRRRQLSGFSFRHRPVRARRFFRGCFTARKFRFPSASSAFCSRSLLA